MAFEYWDKLLYGIEQCTLFLGPELPCLPPGGDRWVPAQDLAARLACRLKGNCDGESGERDDLARIAQRVVRIEDEAALEIEVKKWHTDLDGVRSTLHDDLATLPFRRIVTSAHDPLMETALRHAGKTPAVDRYHFRGTSPELLPEPTIEAPILYHLYGHAAEPPSVVLAETHLLDFLVALISRDPPLPHDVNAALTNDRFFLFLGFGLDRWYLRILLHVLKVLRPGTSSFAVEAPPTSNGGLEDDAILFYRDNFRLGVHRADVVEFVGDLRSRYRPSKATSSQRASAPDRASGPAPTVFICHASEDHERAREVHDHLRAAGIEPWFDRESLRGGDRWDELIESTILEIDHFVVLNSHALRAKSRGVSYVNKEINVALRAGDWRLAKSFIIPLKIDDAPLLDELREYHAVDLDGPHGPRDLVRAIKRRTGPR